MQPFIQPMPLLKRRLPFDHPDWLFQLKYDGFRALARISVDVASSSHETATRSLRSPVWRTRSDPLPLVHDAVLDGEKP